MTAIDEVRARIGAPIVLTLDYGTAAWLMFYLPSHPPVEQIIERAWWLNSPPPDPALFDGPVMYVCSGDCGGLALVQRRFTTVELAASLPRTLRGMLIQDYRVYRLAGPIGPTLDPP